MNKKVSVLESKIVFDDFYKLEEATYTYEMLNGEMTEPVTRLCFHRGNSVAGIVYNTSTSKAILVRQFRYAALKADGGWVTEVAVSYTHLDVYKRQQFIYTKLQHFNVFRLVCQPTTLGYLSIVVYLYVI